MPDAPLPFFAGQASGLDELSGANPAAINVLVDSLNAVHVWPGIQAWEDFGTSPNPGVAVIGVYEWRGNTLMVFEDRSFYAMTSPGSFSNLGTLGGTGRPIWAYDQARVIVSGGGAPLYWTGVGAATSLVGVYTDPSGAPLTFTHVAYSAQRIIGNVNNNSGTIQWTPILPGNHTTWPIVGPYYAEAEAAADPVVALYANANEVFTFGTETTQVYVPDPSLAFAVAASQQVGCAAAYSVINTDSDFAWLDNDHRFTEGNGRDFKVLSSPGMAKDVANLSVISDCWGARIKFEGFDLLVWTFPTEKRSIYYDRVTQKWGERRSTDSNGNWTGWIATSYYFSSSRNVHLVGLSDGRIAEMTTEASTDMGQTLRGLVRTGFNDQGSFARKDCQRLFLQLRRDAVVGAEPTDPRVEYRFRDTLGSWSTSTAFPLGGSYEPIVDKWSQGIFRQRQHEISFTNAGGFVLSGAVMTFEQLES